MFELQETGTVGSTYVWRCVVSNLKSVSVFFTPEDMENAISIKLKLSKALKVRKKSKIKLN